MKPPAQADNGPTESQPQPQGNSKPDPKPRPQPQPSPESALPWIAEVKSGCAAYKSAPNEIKKSAVFNEVKALVARTTVESVRGKLKQLSTNQGGSEVTIRIDVGDVEFTTEGLFSAIKKGTPVYDAAAEMKIGQCVIFSAEKLKPSSITEQSQVCDTEYFATFTKLAPCE